MAKEITGELTRVGSHSVRLELAPEPRAELGTKATYRWQITKEEFYPVILTEWRGESVNLECSADRYLHSSGMSEWRIYARAGKIRSEDEAGNVTYGREITETARRRLFTELEHLVSEWLEGEEYRAGHRRAVFYALGRLLRDRYSDAAIRDLYSAAGAMVAAGEISADDRIDWLRVAEARQTYERELEELETHGELS
jgi:hypothetical protein